MNNYTKEGVAKKNIAEQKRGVDDDNVIHEKGDEMVFSSHNSTT